MLRFRDVDAIVDVGLPAMHDDNNWMNCRPLKTESDRRPGSGQVFRAFWHGPPLDFYNLLCLRSFVAQGHRVELFTYDEELVVPGWIVRRNANEIWPTDQVLRYQSGGGIGSPSLHSNLFRLILLQCLGGWWIDADVILLRPNLPDDTYFFAYGDRPYVNNAVMKFPLGHPLLAEGIEYCRSIGETAIYGQTGPGLLTNLVGKYDLTKHVRSTEIANPVPWWDIEAFFDPRRCEEVRERCVDSIFAHLCQEIWRHSGIPSELAPPHGSFFDHIISRFDLDVRFSGRMDFAAISQSFGRTMRAELMRRVISNEVSLEERTGRILAIERALEERNHRILSLEATLAERDQRLLTLERANGGQSIDAHDSGDLMRRLASNEEALEERTGRLLALERALNDRDQRIISLERTLEERDQRLRTLEGANG